MKSLTKKNILLLISLLLISIYTLKAQTITSMSPTAGSLGGNTTVKITGTGFVKSNIQGIYLKNHGAVKSYNFVSSTLITFVTNSTSATSIDSVYVEFLRKNKTPKKVYVPSTFEYKLPEITEISPNSSSVKGNDTITITGKYFYGASYVQFDKAGNPTITVTNSKITVINPPHVSGKIDVQVQVQGNFSKINKASKFTYASNAPKGKYTVSLENLTGLNKKYKVYVLGYSPGSKKMLTLNTGSSTGKFTPIPSTSKDGYIESYELGKEITEIEVNNTNPIVGARIYFFIKDTTKTYQDNSKKTANHNLGFSYSDYGKKVSQVSNPPQSEFPQYNYIEATFKSNEGLYIDISTVDGFFFPLSLIAQDKNGKELDRIGQPKNILASQIVKAYKPFMKKLKIGGEDTDAYNDLYYKVNSDLTALFNPGLYLEDKTSDLETVFDSALNTLFTSTTLKMNIWQNGNNNFEESYTVTPVKNRVFPGTTNTHDALEFIGTDPKVLHVFNPVGFSVVSYKDKASKIRKPIMGTIKNNILTFKTTLPLNTGLKVGMYVSDGGGSTDGTTQITKINTSTKGIVSVTLNSSNDYSVSFQYKFSKAPKNYYTSSGQMTFAGIGLFADGVYRYSGSSASQKNYQVVVNGLENQISTALNRGVALLASTNTTLKGHTTKTWGQETAWYPKNQPQNYFSYFMHTAKVNGTNIFTLPSNSVKSARKDYMARSYGFAYDENPIGGYKGPQVPSEFPGAYPKGTETLKLVLGAWK